MALDAQRRADRVVTAEVPPAREVRDRAEHRGIEGEQQQPTDAGQVERPIDGEVEQEQADGGGQQVAQRARGDEGLLPAPDADVMTRPNYDGPVRVLPEGATVTSLVLDFRPDGTVANVVSNVPQNIDAPLTVTVTRNSQSRTVTVNGAGKIQLQ